MVVSPLPAFVPFPLLAHGSLQTLASQLGTPRQVSLTTETLRVPLDDGDICVVECDASLSLSATVRPVVLLVHGLTGSSESSYMRRLAAKLVRKGFDVARMNHRGTSPIGYHGSRKLSHAGSSGDIAQVAAALGRRHAAVFVVGFSLSANMVLRWLGATPQDDPLAGAPHVAPQVAAACAVCPPVDLACSAAALTKRANRWIDWYFCQRLVAQVRHHCRHNAQRPVAFGRRMRVFDFDATYVAPANGFRDRDDYYYRCSSLPHLKMIQLPTTILATKDDPVVPVSPVLTASLGPGVTLRVEKSGGHMGFFQRDKNALGDRHWLDWFLVRWAEESWAKSTACAGSLD